MKKVLIIAIAVLGSTLTMPMLGMLVKARALKTAQHATVRPTIQRRNCSKSQPKVTVCDFLKNETEKVSAKLLQISQQMEKEQKAFASSYDYFTTELSLRTSPFLARLKLLELMEEGVNNPLLTFNTPAEEEKIQICLEAAHSFVRTAFSDAKLDVGAKPIVTNELEKLSKELNAILLSQQAAIKE